MELTPTEVDVYLEVAFTRMLQVADRLGESKMNERPHGEGTNSVAALIVHCCAVTEFWLGHVALGEPTDRDRDREFSTTATSTELRQLVAATHTRATEHLARLEAGEGTDDGRRALNEDRGTSDAAIALHVLEELFQHLGHMDLTADALGAG